MNEDLSKKLLKDFPQLFRNPHESCMQRRFDCGDGWFDLIYKLAQDIEAVARESGLNPNSQKWPLCRQVKQKMGSLRFAVFSTNEPSELYKHISGLRQDALNQSLHICEYCGSSGVFVQDSIATLCQDHFRQV